VINILISLHSFLIPSRNKRNNVNAFLSHYCARESFSRHETFPQLSTFIVLSLDRVDYSLFLSSFSLAFVKFKGLTDYVRRQVKCPECRAEHRIPYNGVQGFPTNVTLQRFLELHIEITGDLPDPTSGEVSSFISAQ
jgi:hypothetical protein